MSVAFTASKIHAELTRLQPDLIDMRSESQLERSMITPVEFERDSHSGESDFSIDRLEDSPILGRPIPPSRRSSGFRYFLDGAQRTLLAYLIDGVPILTCVTAAGILERDTDGSPTLMPDSLRLRHAWLVPLASGRPGLDRLASLIDSHGGEVLDPIAERNNYETALNDYASMVTYGYQRGNQLRESVESELLEFWQAEAEPGWIVVDGALRTDVPRAVGLVKSFTKQYLTGSEADVMFRLPQKTRTSAFRVQDKWREGRKTCWYQRFWNSTGRDVRHSLVRIETSDRVDTTAEIDEIAGWLIAERLPRATADQRWATLLYPVHYLEEILKRKIDAETRGWPAAS